MSFIETAAQHFMLLQVTIRKWSGVQQLKRGSTKAAEAAKANPDAARMYVNLLGSHHSDLKLVNAKFSAVRTYLYEQTLPFTDAGEGQQKRGARIATVSRLPEILAELARLKHEAQAALDEFIPEYTRLRDFAMQYDMGDWRDEVSYPEPSEIISRFAADVAVPQPIPTCDLSSLRLPAGLAAEIAARHSASIEAQLEGAKQAAMDSAQAHMDVIGRQMDSGTRLSQSLIDNAAHHATMLRDMVSGYDSDPRVLQLADLIDDRIASVGSIDKIKDSEALRSIVSRTASTVSKGLREIAAAPKAAAPQKINAETLVTGDSLLADLID